MRTLELCAGAGGQALGLEMAGFSHVGLIENDPIPCQTIRHNRPKWSVIEEDLKIVSSFRFKNIDLICGGIPCQPFTIAGQQRGHTDERDLFPEAVRFVRDLHPKYFFFENVKGFSTNKFKAYREKIIQEFEDIGYFTEWNLVFASNYGVPQLRPRFILVGRKDESIPFPWPKPYTKQLTVADSISDLMGKYQWKGLNKWKKQAQSIAPTIVGGSKKHGGADLGPSRARRDWLKLGVKGTSLADDSPSKDFNEIPRLTNRMVARIQGFPDNWHFCGKKTSINRQIGNAFPPPVAMEIGKSILKWDTRI